MIGYVTTNDVNTAVLVLWRYLKYLHCRAHLSLEQIYAFQGDHITLEVDCFVNSTKS